MTTSAMKSPDHSQDCSHKNEVWFTPNIKNYRTSLAYEGLALKKSSESKTIADLKRQYSR